MRIENTGFPAISTSAPTPEGIDQRNETEAARQGTVDSVSLSSRARLLAVAKRALAEVPAVRAPVVERARERLQAGQYQADSRAIAEAIIEALRESG